ncbi:MAG: beta-mannanase, partial [Proteobacteria bacterium]|nr:beta-mannanase [Pseudomonadota bacterium]
IVAEWGVGEFPPGDKAEYFRKAFADMKSRYPRVRAAVYWHEGWENKDESYTNMYVNSSTKALNAFKQAVKDPYWIGFPQYRQRHTEP